MDKHTFIVNSSVFVVNEQNQVLLVQRSMDEDVSPGKWGIPGGKLDNTDDSLEDGLKREVMEEVGIEISDVQLFESHLAVTEVSNRQYSVFTAKHASGESKALEDTAAAGWFSLEGIPPKENFTKNTYELLQELMS